MMITDKTDTQAKPVLDSVPDGRLGLVPTVSMTEFGRKVNDYLVAWRKQRSEEGISCDVDGYARDSFIISAITPRFGSGEGKGQINETIRGDDLYFLVDVMNNSVTYKMADFENYMSPDDHFADLKRLIAACGKKANRVNVIMPYLYEGRQINQNGRESLDCASALQELVDVYGVDNIICFDAHDARVQNAIPMSGFETVRPTYQFIKNILRYVPDIQVDNDHLAAISPDEAGMSRAIYLANVLGIDMGMFYKRRDYTTVVNGTHPIAAHEYLGPSVEGKDVIIIDDMISSGDAVLETAQMLKKNKAKRIFICATFGVFTGGTAPFDEAYRHGLFDKLITTNLIHQPDELLEKEYYISCDMSKYVALIIDTLNHDASLSPLLKPNDRIQKVLEKYRNGEKV